MVSTHGAFQSRRACVWCGAVTNHAAPLTKTVTEFAMAHSAIPHLANDAGVDRIAIGVKEFQCMGARPPFDHPHVFLDMGAETQIICPYCSTLYIHDGNLPATKTSPPGALVDDTVHG
jgi:uncharacterized Zn-finger protein